MAPVTIAPATEALTAIRDQINSGGAYVLAVSAAYREVEVDPLEEIRELKVDVVTEHEQQLNETLAVEDRTSHALRIWIRAPVRGQPESYIDDLKLLVRQIFQRVNNFDSADRRVSVWECDGDPKQCPDKELLREKKLFVACIPLRVEVEPP